MALFKRPFAQLIISGEQGRGKTVLAYNALLADSPAAVVERLGPDAASAQVLLSMAKTPVELAKLPALRYFPQGFVIDEAALFSRDSAHFASAKAAVYTVRGIVNSIRAFTPRLYIVAQDVAIVPAALRAPADWVLQVEGVKVVEERAGYKIGAARGYVLRRYVSKHRSPRSEREYYEYASFEVPVVLLDAVRQIDLQVKRRYLTEIIDGRRGKKVVVTSTTLYAVMRKFTAMKPLGGGKFEAPCHQGRPLVPIHFKPVFEAALHLAVLPRGCLFQLSPPGVADAMYRLLAERIGPDCLFNIMNYRGQLKIAYVTSRPDAFLERLSQEGLIELWPHVKMVRGHEKHIFYLPPEAFREVARIPRGRELLQCLKKQAEALGAHHYTRLIEDALHEGRSVA